jgi:hypothetical protein
VMRPAAEPGPSDPRSGDGRGSRLDARRWRCLRSRHREHPRTEQRLRSDLSALRPTGSIVSRDFPPVVGPTEQLGQFESGVVCFCGPAVIGRLPQRAS